LYRVANNVKIVGMKERELYFPWMKTTFERPCCKTTGAGNVPEVFDPLS